MRKCKTTVKALDLVRKAVAKMDAMGLLDGRKRKEKDAAIALITKDTENLNRFLRGDSIGVVKSRTGEVIAFFTEDTMF